MCRVGSGDDGFPGWPLPHGLGVKVATFAATVALGLGVLASPVAAADGAAIGKCLLKSCKVELAKCVTNPGCAANLLCIQACNGRADEGACQIGCGDVFDNPVIGEFNKCAVSQQGCVPQRSNDNSYPLPAQGSMVEAFNTKIFSGRYYISAGLNQIFDTFPCQVWSDLHAAPNRQPCIRVNQMASQKFALRASFCLSGWFV
jgi:violaxanthin de-epoxidase